MYILTLAGFTGVLFQLLLIDEATSAKILMVPNQSLSHVRYFAQVGKPLVERGHSLYAVINGACGKSVETLEKAGVRTVRFYTADRTCYTQPPAEQNEDQFTKMAIRKGSFLSQISVFQEQSRHFLADADALFGDRELLGKLKKEHMDLCIIDGFVLALNHYILPYKLGIPHITHTTGYDASWIGVASMTSFEPNMITKYSDKMSFLERVDNTIITCVFSFMGMVLPGSSDGLVTKYAPEKPAVTLRTLQRKSKLWLLNTDSVLDYPRATLPHVVHIGGLSTGPAHPLPDSLASVVDGAENGIIVVSFGSLLKGIPMDMVGKFISAFRMIPDVSFVMKYTGAPVSNLPDNVKMLPWLPQSDLLGHPKTRAFITHCGNNGQFEGLYHAVPMIGIPFFGDQMYNSARMQAKGFGIAMDVHEFTPEELTKNIKEILTNNTYVESIKRASAVYRSRLLTPEQRAVYWIEHVLRFGSDHLLSHGTGMPWYQFWLIDVYAFLAAIVLFTFMLVIALLKFCFTRFCTRTSKQKMS